MPRKRLYENNADRQKAYRQRVPRSPSPASALPRKRRPPSRPARLQRLRTELAALAQEYQDWLGTLPESLQDTPQASRLTETVEQLTAALELLESVDPPRGFGRD
ncbi:MAG: hypothetical protein ACYCW6_15790 [Candidatus Xenobia bacterium]